MNFGLMMDEIFKVLKHNLNEHQNKIKKLKNEMQILNRNKFSKKIYTLLIFWLISWFIIMLALFILYIKGIHLSFLELLIWLVLTFVIGIISTIIFYRCKNYKLKMLGFCNPQNQKEILEEEINCLLEIKRLDSQVIMLEKSLNYSKHDNPYLEYILKNYDIPLKSKKSKQMLEENIQNIRNKIHNYQDEIDIINNKSSLFNIFKKFKNRKLKILNYLLSILIGLSFAILLFSLPLNLVISSSFQPLLFIIPGLAGGIIGYIINLTNNKIYLKTYQSLEKRLIKKTFLQHFVCKNQILKENKKRIEKIIKISCEIAIESNINYFILEQLNNKQ